MSKAVDLEVQSSLNLKNFKLSEILFNNAAKRMICLLGSFPASETDKAIVVIQKYEFAEKDFTEDNADDSFLKHIETETVMLNNIYSDFTGLVDPKFNKLKVSIIYPATEKHIIKFTVQEQFLVEETPEMYRDVTIPYLEKEQFSLDWVYNILEHKAEQDKIVYEDPEGDEKGFVLVPDYKWNGQVETLYLLAIVMNRNIKSIRDLNGSHLSLLEHIKAKSLEAIKSKYGLEATQIRAYFHYQPSFYHLHVHFTYLNYEAPGIFCEKSHLLSTVINNIKLLPDYYQNATLTFTVREKDKLYQAIKEMEK